METKQAPPHRPHGNGIIVPEIAIISPDTLSNIGLQNLLQEVIPQAVIRAFRSFADFADDTPDMYAHYFISAQVYFEHTGFFLPRRPKAIVLTGGEELQLPAGILTLNTHQNEKDLAKSILLLRTHGHPQTGKQEKGTRNTADAHELSAREAEVLVLLAKGLINKEIADKLGISLTTVITHRKNITEKLGIKSVAGLAIYAVLHGYIEADSI